MTYTNKYPEIVEKLFKQLTEENIQEMQKLKGKDLHFEISKRFFSSAQNALREKKLEGWQNIALEASTICSEIRQKIRPYNHEQIYATFS